MGARKKFVGIAAAAALVLSGGMGSAQAAPAQVTKKHLPTKAEVGKVVPAVKGGHVFNQKMRMVEAPGKTCRGSKTFKADSGRMAVYMPDFDMEAEPNASDFSVLVTVQTVRFANKAKAKGVVAAFQRYAKRCSGKVYDGAKTIKISVPKLGDQRVGLGMEVVGEQEEPWANMIVARRGRTVVQAMQMDVVRPAKSQTIALAKLALKRSR